MRSNIPKFPTPGNDLWSQARKQITTSLLPAQQDNSNSLPRAKAIDQIPTLCPAGLTLIGALTSTQVVWLCQFEGDMVL